MKKVIERPQQSDMGSGYGYIEGCEGVTLSEVLKWLKANTEAWGTININFLGEPLRIFDYDTYNGNQFYCHMNGFDYQRLVKEVKFRYCFMNEDIYIYLKE